MKSNTYKYANCIQNLISYAVKFYVVCIERYLFMSTLYMPEIQIFIFIVIKNLPLMVYC